MEYTDTEVLIYENEYDIKAKHETTTNIHIQFSYKNTEVGFYRKQLPSARKILSNILRGMEAVVFFSTKL